MIEKYIKGDCRPTIIKKSPIFPKKMARNNKICNSIFLQALYLILKYYEIPLSRYSSDKRGEMGLGNVSTPIHIKT